MSLLAGIFGGDLGGIRRRLARALETHLPADDQEMALPCASVMVIMVLLNGRVHVRNARRDVLALARLTRAASLAMIFPFEISAPP
jgi:hypothetical protein